MIDNRAGSLPAPGATSALQAFFARWSRDPSRWRARFHLAAFAVAIALVIALAQVIDWPNTVNLQIQAGDISPIDIRSPHPLTYGSALLTAEAQARAGAAVAPVYDPPQTRIARQQLTRAAQVLDFIQRVRNDPYANESQRIRWLQNIADLSLDKVTALLILNVSDQRWPAIAEETVRVLDVVMRSVIREGELANAQRNVPSEVGFSFSDDETVIITLLVQGLLRPNTFFNAERTESARAEASNRVQPVDRTIAAGETILRAGDRVEPLDIETLDALGLMRIERTWRDYLTALLLGALLSALFVAFVSRSRRHFWADGLRAFLLGLLFGSFVFLGKIMAPTETLLPYLYPLAAMTMLIGALIDLPIATVATIEIGLLILVFTRGETEVATYAVVGALVGALVLGRAERLSAFAWSGVWIVLANLAILTIFRLPLLTNEPRALLELAAAAAVNGIFASSFTLVIFYLLGQVFGLATSLQLLELSRPTHPLLRQLLLKAPGTYYHTLIVSNMAEEAASAIGADPLFARVGSYYHDIGKSVRPYFFIENYTEGINPHERLDPYTSARIIISHVHDGVELAKKYKLPETLIDFVREHHGATRVEYFYHQACQEASNPDEVEEAAFRYPGPKPRTRETAILMLADGCEATVRAMAPRSPEEIADLIHNVLNRRLMLGQLDESGLTLREMNQIADAFLRVLKGIHHPRIRYPAETPPAPARVAA